MGMSVRFTTGRAVEPVDLEELKSHVVQSSDQDDDDLQLILNGAILHIEKATNSSLGERSIIADFTRLGKRKYLDLPYGPVRSITKVEKIFQDGTTEELVDGTGYYKEGLDDIRINLYSIWGSAAGTVQTGIRVEYVAGYSPAEAATTTALPPALKRAVLKYAGIDYEYPVGSEKVTALDKLADEILRIIQPYIRGGVYL